MINIFKSFIKTLDSKLAQSPIYRLYTGDLWYLNLYNNDQAYWERHFQASNKVKTIRKEIVNFSNKSREQMPVKHKQLAS